MSLIDQGAVNVVAGQGPDDVRGLVEGKIAAENPPLFQVAGQAGLVGAAPGLDLLGNGRDLLRAIGLQRGQLGQMIAAESVIIAVIGAVLGTALGLGLGAALAAAFTRSQVLTVVIPAGQIVAYVVAAAFAGLLAAIAPARRAAKMNMLAAIAAE